MKGYFGLAVAIFCVLVPAIYAGCVERGCCRGKDNHCWTKGPRMNPASNKTECFCDETCYDLGDCCTDYTQACIEPSNGYGAEDCILDAWGEWSECDNECGQGTQTRQRRIIQEKKFGGLDCDVRIQKKFCRGEKCARRREQGGALEASETGSILPASFGQWRTSKVYNPYLDIRKNIWQTKEKTEAPSYTTMFEITATRHGCKKALGKKWAATLTEGQRVCVECQASAMKHRLGGRCKGHGAYLLETGWKAVTVRGCHGKWKMVSQHEEGNCDQREDHSFILI